jgi:hypothetical protein
LEAFNLIEGTICFWKNLLASKLIIQNSQLFLNEGRLDPGTSILNIIMQNNHVVGVKWHYCATLSFNCVLN